MGTYLQQGLWLLCLFVAFVQVWILCSRGKHPKETPGYRRWLWKRKGKALLRLFCCMGLCALVTVAPILHKELEHQFPLFKQAETYVAEKMAPTAEKPDWLCYYNQKDEPWGSQTYGPVDLIADTGCGPTVLAMVVSSLSEEAVTPKEMADWAYENGYCSVGSGSFHTLIGEGLSAFGFSNHTAQSGEEVKEALRNHQVVVALMGEGHFTGSGHFILLCNIDDADTVFVADSNHEENMERRWPLETILEEAKPSPVTDSAFWIVETPVAQAEEISK